MSKWTNSYKARVSLVRWNPVVMSDELIALD